MERHCVSRVKMSKTVKQILNYLFLVGETQLLKQVQILHLLTDRATRTQSLHTALVKSAFR